MLSRDEALKVCETVLAHARTAGAEDAIVSLRSSVESHARFAGNSITTSGRSQDLDITATVWVGRRRGSIIGNDSGADALKRMADEAVQVARVSPVHREYVPTLGPLDYAESRGFAGVTAEVDVKARAAALEAVLTACRSAKVTGAGFHTSEASAVAAATANGNRRYFQSSEADFSVTARSADGTGSGYYSGDHFDLARLDAKHIAEQAVGKAVRSQQPKAIEPGTYPVILEPQAVGDLIGFLTNAFDARTADEGRSAFSSKDGKSRLGEKMFSERINLYSDPMHPDLPVVPSTSEGIPASRLSLVKSGVIENFEYSRYWAEQRKRAPTPGPVNYILESSQPAVSMDDMIAGMPRGLLISRFWYVRLVDPRTIVLTGLTRDGLWWIEKGKISHPVGNLRFNQGVLAMLAPWNVDAVGAAQRVSRRMVPALKLSAFTFTSISDAI
ncbi:MAG TPA: TldD/PmbA family protein [Vicinamibacterales bacterium]|nr:TldD/PmbA family protein [Vicinamibacterales bacterium]